MSIAIRYYSKSGNTKKLAEAISEAIGIEAKDVSEKLKEDVDILFIGNSVYWAGIDDAVKDFLKDPGAKINKVVNFSTAAFIKSSYAQMTKICEELNLSLSEEEFHCKGQFKMFNKGKPDETDLEAAKTFAKKIVAE